MSGSSFERPEFGDWNDLVFDEEDWWNICLAYIVNENITVAAGYADLGNILEENEDNVVAFQMRYKF